MKKQLFSAALAALCLTGTAIAQEPTIEWSVVQNSLGTIEPGGIQMHGTAAVEVGDEIMLYAIGGNRWIGADSVNITYAPLTLEPQAQTGTWQHATWQFPTATNPSNVTGAAGSAYIERATFVYNGRIYVVGGTHNTANLPAGSAVNGIRVFEPTATGDILEPNAALGFDGAAAGVTPSLAGAGQSAVLDPDTGYLYVFGNTTSVRRFHIDSSTGAVSDYQSFESQLLYHASMASGAVIHNGYIYIFSTNQADNQGSVQYAPVNPDGTLGTFVRASASLPVRHIDGGSVVMNGNIYVAAGYDSASSVAATQNASVINAVHRAVIDDATGNITAWAVDAPIPNAGTSTPAGMRRIGIAPLPDDQGFVIVGGRHHGVYLEHVFVAQPIDSSVDMWSLY